MPAKFKVAIPSRCINIIGEPQNIRELLQPKAMATFSSGCNFMMGLGKRKLRTKFEVASFSRCRNNKGEAPNFGELP